MKKLLLIFSIFAITTLPAMASANSKQKAEINAAAEWNQMLFDNDFLLPEKYTPKKNEIINAPVSQSTEGTCNGKPYKCNVGDILNECSPCPEFVAELQIEEQFINEYVRKKCNNSTEPTATSGAKEVTVTKCNPDTKNGITAKKDFDGVCVPTECLSPRWELSDNDKRAKCVEQKCKIENGTGEWTPDGNTWKCTLKRCKKGYKHDKEKNKCSRDGEPDANEDDDTATTDTSPSNDEDEQTQQNESRLSETDPLAKIDELRDNAEAMRAKEQSAANKLLGAAGIGTTGIGAMQTASAMAEQNADADAERTMRAYLATFHCDYGAGKSIQGGQSNIDLPGGNELIGLYSEYVNLANDLKVRKNALNIRPGIESEPILDAATSGLYDDVAIGTTSGAYTSLARALMDPNGADAAAWAQQKSDTADRKKAGMITAGIGVAGSLAANLAINHFENKKSKILTELQTEIADIPPQTAPCPNGTTGDQHPNCTCDDKIYNPNSKRCEPCLGNQIVNNNNCQCPANLPLWDTEQDKCIARPCTPQCTPTEGDHLIVLQDCSCTCNDGYDYKNGKCVCESPKQFLAPSGKCVHFITQQVTVPKITNNHTYTIVNTHTTVDKASLPAGSLFKIGSAELLNQAKQPLNNFIAQLSESGYTDCQITITGYTDPVGNSASNKTLSIKRAEAVKEYFNGKKADNKLIKTISSSGLGEANCTCGAGKLPGDTPDTINGQKIDYNNQDYKICKNKDSNYSLSGNVRYAPCRRVDITVNCDQKTTQTTTQTTTYTTSQ
ncbi:MAG: OmpA family protein [Alphaproteobacteria bacterium]|nr:OmpA family protein [Alphaproteobacteria bacterium]